MSHQFKSKQSRILSASLGVLAGGALIITMSLSGGPRAMAMKYPLPNNITVKAAAPTKPTAQKVPVKASAAAAAGKAGKATSAQATSATADWHKDPLCQMIFFTTLEGLYRDGVSTEVVDLILGKDSKLDNKVKHDFVFKCKLCHAVYEAFALYRQRPTFNGSNADTFVAQKTDAKLIARLRSKNAATRVMAMGSLVQPWIKAKLHTMKLSDKDKARVMKGLINLADEGKQLTMQHRRNDPAYKDWLFYGACQACSAIETVAKTMPKKPIDLTEIK